MNQAPFAWHILEPDSVSLTLTTTDDVTHKIELRELPKAHFEKMLADVYGKLQDEMETLQKKYRGEPEQAEPAKQGEAPTPKKEVSNTDFIKMFSESMATQGKVLYKYLAMSARDSEQNEKWFEALEKNDLITTRQFAGLIYNLMTVCHVNEVIGSMGNALALAANMNLARAEASSESPSPETTPPA